MITRIIASLAILCGLAGAPSPVQAQTVAAGASHTVVVKPDGTVWSFGVNTYGQLGDATTTQRTTPVQVSAATNIIAVAAGTEHTLALESNGTVWAWGRNNNGQLGDGTTTTRTAPVIVAGLPPISAIAAGTSHSVALGNDGSIWTWGYNLNGQLGDGTTTRSLQPLTVATGWTAAAIGAGHSHTLAVKADGTLWGWGANNSGQLGAATPTQWNLPAAIAGVTGAISTSGGSCHTAVVRSDGKVLTSGCNGSGQLGNNTFTNRPTMDLVLNLVNATAVRAGASSTSALTSAGEVWSWGSNLYGQIGNGTTTTQRLPVRTLTTGTISQVAAGHNHGIAVTTTGVVFTWGQNPNGQLGDGTLLRRLTPVAISDVNYVWKVATPTLSVAGGPYSTDQTVVVTVSMTGAEMHYTVDGTDPTLMDPVVASGSSVAIDKTMTLKVRAWKDTMPPSDIVSATYTMTVATPGGTPNGGTYSTAQTVTLSVTTPGATIRYTTNNTTPTETSTVYTGPFQVATTTTVRAIGFRTGWTNSGVRAATYTMNFGTLAAPQMTPGAGTYASEAVVTISALPGATIRYTTNGTTPSSFSTLYTGPLTMATTQTLKAIALHPDYAASPVTTAVYTIVAAAPVFTPGAGTYTPGQVVTVTCATAGATIRYTLDGRDPTDTDPIVASGGTFVIGNYTLKARASKSGTATSTITTAVYQLSAALTSAQVDGGTSRSILVRPDGLAYAWGFLAGNGVIQGSHLPVPTGTITGIVAAAAGGAHMLVATADGSVHAWGSNLNGHVGDGTTTQRTTPVRLTTITNVTRVAAGGKHSIALKQDGTVWAWGSNAQGQIGDGSTIQRNSPVAVPGLTGVTAVAAGEDFTLVLKSDGTVWAWGDNAYGQLGDGSTTDKLQPARITSLSNIIAISAGFGHAIALRNNGSVWGWGYNTFGQVGNGSTAQQLTPVSIAGLPSVTAVAAGGFHSLTRSSDGSVRSWGNNGSGQLGDGTTVQRTTPDVVPSLTGIIAVGAGYDHSLAIAADGTVLSWGDNDDGELGDGTVEARLVPEGISGPAYNWKAWSPAVTPASGLYTAAQTAVITSRDVNPVTIRYTVDGSEPTETATEIASGGTVPIGQSTTLKVKAWKAGAPVSVTAVRAYELKVLPPGISPAAGSYTGAIAVTLTNPNPAGTITYTTDGSEPVAASTVYGSPVPAGETVTFKARAHRPGWTSSDTAYSSYWITEGVAATPTMTPAAGAYDGPRLVTLASATATAAIRYTLDGTEPTESSTLYRFPFVISTTTTVKARAFRAGMTASAVASAAYAMDASGATPTPAMVPAGGRFTVRQTVAITGAAGATLRFTLDGRDPTTADPVVGAGGTVLVDRSQVLKVRAWQAGLEPSAVRRGFFVITGEVRAGNRHTLALKTDGTVWAWGYNFYGSVGDGSTTNRLSPVQVAIADVQAIAAGYAHSLALKRDGTVWGWGENGCGQLGDNTTTNRLAPVQVSGLTNVVAIAAGGESPFFTYSHSLALKADGTVWAWGCNQLGQLGDGSTTGRKLPVQVAGLQRASAIAAGGRHSYAIEGAGIASGTVWAWGNNAGRQLGDGSTTERAVPVRVLNLTDVIRIEATQGEALAVRRDGTVWAWHTGLLQLTGTGAKQLPFLDRALAIGAGDYTMIAIDANGIRWAWGSGGYGELGTVDRYISDPATLASNRVRETMPTLQVDGGGSHSVLLRLDGTVAVAGDNAAGQLGNGTTTDALTFIAVPGLSLVDNAWLATDGDADGLSAWREWLAGTDPHLADTNGNGILDGIEEGLGPDGANPDTDRDGLTNAEEMQRGTDAFTADTDGDGVVDGADAFPADPTRSSLPPPNPADTTPPVITLTQPTSARPVGGGGGL